MKLPNDIKEAITKELIDELHQDLIHFCVQCNADIPEDRLLCSKECIEQDLENRWKMSEVYRIEKEGK